METTLAFIGFAVAILGLIATILKLILHIKQIRRENRLEKQRTEAENQARLDKVREEESRQKEKNEVLQASMDIITDYIENELAWKLQSYVKEKDLKTLDADIKTYIRERLAELQENSGPAHPEIRKKVEKTLSEKLGIDFAAEVIDAEGNYDNFLKSRAERRIRNSKLK